jgi:hypothetical protein
MLVVSALDDVAWLLNIRGSDVEYNPVWCVGGVHRAHPLPLPTLQVMLFC